MFDQRHKHGISTEDLLVARCKLCVGARSYSKYTAPARCSWETLCSQVQPQRQHQLVERREELQPAQWSGGQRPTTVVCAITVVSSRKLHIGTTKRMHFNVSVTDDECPAPAETRSACLNVSTSLSCKQREVLNLNATKVQWLKDCRSLEQPGNSVWVNEDGYLRLPAVTERDAGKYTCLVTVSFNGRTYTSARSIQLLVDHSSADSFIAQPLVVSPEHEEKHVDLGAREELTCVAYIGVSENADTIMYWTVNGSFVELDKLLHMSVPVFNSNRGRVLGTLTLTVSKVLRRHLDVPFHCIVTNTAGQSEGKVLLHEADHSSFYKWMSLCLAIPLAVSALAACLFFNRIDLALAYRKLMRHLGKLEASDGGVYDAYVSFLNSNDLSSSKPETFALQVLPEKLENQHGYSLYISGRDDCPGEAKHEVIADTMRKSRRLLIILSAQPLSMNDKNQDCPLLHKQTQYEQALGLHDALTHNSLKVILVEVDGPVDYSRLPESLQYVKRKQGAIKWKTKTSNRQFWNKLLYHMPPIPASRRHATI
ncbi:interleukin-1 receptor type 1 isoform X1 [Synchiropus splendidus]|uniref:interleukin-1 receptor type 1 isoform X1 n=2 Tax=Synchiropus splendidus TaxID=270530 RepID=UPI00237D6A85|nr:interleukin-1 receptor type 1 isoform X1 [Synchiropus splendidus]